jgi:hypothetical protein
MPMEIKLIQKEIPPSWENNYFFKLNIAKLRGILERMVEDSERFGYIVPPIEELNIIDFGGGAGNNKDFPSAIPEDELAAIAAQSGMSVNEYRSGYEPWFLRAAYALGIGDKGVRLNLEIQPQSKADGKYFKQVSIDFINAIVNGKLTKLLLSKNVLPVNGFHIVSCTNLFRPNVLDSSPTALDRLKKIEGHSTPIEAVLKARRKLFELIDIRLKGRGNPPFLNSCIVFNFDEYLVQKYLEYIKGIEEA